MDGSILNLGVDTQQYIPGMAAAAAVTNTFKSTVMSTLGTVTMLGAGLTAAISVPLALMNKVSVDASSIATETGSKFNTVFQGINNTATAAADALSSSYGMAVSTSKELLASTGDILTGFEFERDAALEVSIRVQELSADLVSLQNYKGGVSGASMALTKAMLGETESAKALAIVIRQDSDEYKELVQHYISVEGASLLQAKALTALDIATKQSKNSIGDYARTMHEFANRQRYQSEMMIELKESYGAIILEGLALNQVYSALTAGTKALTATLNLVPPPLKTVIALTTVAAIATGPLILALGLSALAYNNIVQAAPALIMVYQAIHTKTMALTASTFAMITGTDLSTFAFFKQQLGLKGALTALSQNTLATWRLGAVNVGLAVKNGILTAANMTLTSSFVALSGGIRVAITAAATFWTTALAPLLPVIAVVAGVIAGIVLVVASLATQWDNLTASFGIMVASFGVDIEWLNASFTWIKDHALGVVRAVVAGVGVGIALVVSTIFAGVTSVVNGWKMIWGAFEMIGSLIKTFAENTWDAAITTITSGWSVGWNTMLGTTKTVTAGILDALSWLAINAADVMDWIPGMGGASDAIRSAGASLGTKAAELRSGASENFATADEGKQAIKDAWINVGKDDAYGKVLDGYATDVKHLKEQTEKGWDIVANIATGAQASIVDAYTGKNKKESTATLGGQQKFAGLAFQGSVAAYQAEIRRSGTTSEDATAKNTSATVEKLTQVVRYLKNQDNNLTELRGV